jgi:hypothetical protein
MTEKQVFESIKFHRLRVCNQFYALTPQQFAKIYNGYGADSWRSSMRSALTWIFDNFEEVAGCHDVDFHHSDGTKTGFKRTIEHWKKNSSIMLSARYPMSSPTLWIHRAVAWTKLRLAMRAIAGKDAFRFYLDAYKNRIAKEAKE